MGVVPRKLTVVTLLLPAVLSAQSTFFPLKDLKPGMRGTGRTVFSGDKVEEFQVEILGVLENIGPKQSLILGRLSGGPLANTGVMQGMSGSPVYIGGKLAGAVAMAFPFAKEPVAGIRPIEEMVRASQATAETPKRAAVSLTDRDLTKMFAKRTETMAGDARMIDIATPISFGGFTAAAIEHFTPQLRSLGLEPRQGMAAGGRIDPRMGDRSRLKPGSMISVQLMTGDMSIGADGTVTHIDGDKVYAFGHRFLAVGATSLPFARADVVTLLPTLSSSFKVSTARELMGAISQDRNTVVAGELGRAAQMVPVSVAVSREGRKLDQYRMEMVDDRMLSPLLMQLSVYSAIDATERTVGASTFRVTGQIEFHGASAPVVLDNMFASDNGSAALVSMSTAVPLAYVLQSGFSALKLKNVRIEIESFAEKKQVQIDQVVASSRVVRPGEQVEITAVLAGENGFETTRKSVYRVPEGATPGPLYFTVADGSTTNLAEFRQMLSGIPRSPAQLVSTVNNLRGNTKAYVRVWRPEPSYQVEGEEFPDPPPSAALVLAGAQPPLAAMALARNSKIAELEMGVGDMVVSGSKTVQVEVKE